MDLKKIINRYQIFNLRISKLHIIIERDNSGWSLCLRQNNNWALFPRPFADFYGGETLPLSILREWGWKKQPFENRYSSWRDSQ